MDTPLEPEKPTFETRKALAEARAKELGIIPDDSPVFDNVDDLMEYLDNEDYQGGLKN